MSQVPEPNPFENPFIEETTYLVGKSKDTEALVPVGEQAVQVCQPIVKNIVETPIIEEVKEIKNVAIVHKDIVQEIHEQPIIEIAKKHETKVIKEEPFVQRTEAPARYEEISKREADDAKFEIRQQETKHLEEIGDIKHVNLGEDVKKIETQEVIERHVIPTITEVREQKVINVIEQPIVRKIVEKPIIRQFSTEGDFGDISNLQWKTSSVETTQERIIEGGAEMRDSTLEQEKQLPSVQESTHVLMKEKPIQGPLSGEQFAEEISRGKTLLHEAHPFSSEAFKEEIMYGQEVLHTAKPFAQAEFVDALIDQKSKLNKSRYFSKDERIVEFVAQKKLLKPVVGNQYSDELSKLGYWKTDSVILHTVDKLWHTYENVAHKVADTFENVKSKVL